MLNNATRTAEHLSAQEVLGALYASRTAIAEQYLLNDATRTAQRNSADAVLLEIYASRTAFVNQSNPTPKLRNDVSTMPRLTPTAFPSEISPPTRTPLPSITPTRSATTESSVTQEFERFTIYALNNINVRECPFTSCTIIGSLPTSQSALVNGEFLGERVSGSNEVWYQVETAFGVGFVYSQNVSRQRPPVQVNPPVIDPTQPPAQVSTPDSPPTSIPTAAPPISTAVPSQPQLPQSPYTCNGQDDLNCSDFPRDGRSAQAHLLMCGNEDRLDGDGDGRACEYGR